MVEISASANRKIVCYYANYTENINNYVDFICSLEPELKQVLKTRVKKPLITFNLKLEASYSGPSVSNSLENRAFKTSVVEVFVESNISEIIQKAFLKLLN